MKPNDPIAPSTPGGPAQPLAATARNAADRLKSAAQSTAANARDQIAQAAAQKKAQAAERIHGYSSAIHDSAKSFEEKDPNIAWFAHRAADRLQAAADYVRERDFADWRADAEDVARRHPAAFFGGLFVTGLIVGGLLKASRSTPEDTETDAERFAENDDDFQATFPAPTAFGEPATTSPEI